MRIGTAPDIGPWNELEDLTIQVATENGIRYTTFEKIVGGDLVDCLAPDGRHPNAAGHERIFQHFLPV